MHTYKPKTCYRNRQKKRKKKKKKTEKMGAAAANKKKEKMDVYEYCTTNTIPSPPQTKAFTPPLGNTLQTYFPPSTHSPLPYDTRALTALGIARKNRVRIRQEGRPDAFALPVPDLDNDVSLFAKNAPISFGRGIHKRQEDKPYSA